MDDRVAFARVGWMENYRFSEAKEPGPIGGGKYTKDNVGWERDNFLPDENGRVYGYFAMAHGNDALDLSRVVELPIKKGEEKVEGVLVVFVAKNPERDDAEGPEVVGWYRTPLCIGGLNLPQMKHAHTGQRQSCKMPS